MRAKFGALGASPLQSDHTSSFLLPPSSFLWRFFRSARRAEKSPPAVVFADAWATSAGGGSVFLGCLSPWNTLTESRLPDGSMPPSGGLELGGGDARDAEAVVVVVVARRVVVAVRCAAVLRVVVPAAAAFHTVRARCLGTDCAPAASRCGQCAK